MKVVVVYVGREASENFAYGVQTGVWGFNHNGQPADPPQIGDRLLFASGYTGPNIRVPEDQWLKQSITMVAIADVTSALTEEAQPHWRDERERNEVIYAKRFRFERVTKKDGRFLLGDETQFPRPLSLAIRRAAIGHKAQSVPATALPAWLGGSSANPPSVSEPQSEPVLPRSIADTLLEIDNYIAARGYVFSERVLKSLYASLRSKPFAILAGNSGTGKSRLVRLFAEASGATVGNGRFTMIPVCPDWNDSSELLGYFDLNGDFVPGKLIGTLLMAHRDPKMPYFVCLDEMNLARVEHYFSDFLSLIESRRRDGHLIVTDPVLDITQLRRMKGDALRPEARAALDDLRMADKSLGLPPNLFVAGTVNMDETTQPFSRKVLDRAHTLEFNDIDLSQGLEEDASTADVPPLKLDQSFFKSEFTCLVDLLVNHREKAKLIAALLSDLNEKLSLGGFEVGYRVRDEAVSFAVYAEQAGLTPAEISETIVLQKILPRIHGSSLGVQNTLVALLRHPSLNGGTSVPDEGDPEFDQRLLDLRTNTGASAMVRKIAGMLHLYRQENFTSFWLV